MNVKVQEQVPSRSLAQRLEALERANEIRSFRKALKGDLRAGMLSAREVIAEPPSETDTMKVLEVMLAMPKVGRVKAHKWLTRACVSPSKTLGGLTARQRSELLDIMHSYGSRTYGSRV